MQDGIRQVPGLKVLRRAGGRRVRVRRATSLNVYELGDAMDARGWKLDRQMNPPALHVMVTPAHAAVVDQFLTDLRRVREEPRRR